MIGRQWSPICTSGSLQLLLKAAEPAKISLVRAFQNCEWQHFPNSYSQDDIWAHHSVQVASWSAIACVQAMADCLPRQGDRERRWVRHRLKTILYLSLRNAMQGVLLMSEDAHLARMRLHGGVLSSCAVNCTRNTHTHQCNPEKARP